MTFVSLNDPFPPFHRILNANLIDPSVRFCLVTEVDRVPPTYFGVSTMYTTEPVSESRIVVLRISSSSFGVKERFILSRGSRCARGEVMGVGESYRLNDEWHLYK